MDPLDKEEVQFTAGQALPYGEPRFGEQVKDYLSLLGGGAGAGIKLAPRAGMALAKQFAQSQALRQRAAKLADPILEGMFT
jgi:hypothetical protein